jgi:hypothetical protein
MISAVVPGTVGFGQGIGADGADGALLPIPAPPEVAVAVGDDVHAAGLDPVGAAGDGKLVVPVPTVLAAALGAPASANAARLGSISRLTRMSLSSAYGVS